MSRSPGAARPGARGSRAPRAILSGLALGALALAGCAAGADPPQAAGARLQPGAPPRADDLLIVDCLLPGQIRQLGGRMTFVTARRAIKTSGRDCEIRGGEYVAFDRADYRTALRVWLPLAQEGDPAAQTYVGEIFEKGLGVPPDHQAAAEWYRRAAERGYARAAINLGYLHEHGLGVPRDPRQALSWYRRAAGLPALAFEIAPAAEVQELRREVSELRQRLAAREGELEGAQRELAGLRQSVAARGQEAQGEREALARLRQELADSRAGEQAAQGRLRALEQSVVEREARLAARDRELGDLRAALERTQGESDARRAEVERLRREAAAESGARRAELEHREREAAAALARAQQELGALRRAEAERRAQAESERGAVERARQELADSRAREQAAQGRLRELAQAVQEREGRLAARERELADLRARLERSEQASGALRAELDQLRTQTAAAGPEIHLIEPELIATRGTRAARAPEAADRLMVVGRVDSPGGLLSLMVNGREERLDGNLFKAQVAVRRSADERVQIVAIDRAGRRSALEFLVLARPEPIAATAPALPGPVGWQVAGDRAPFGRYHALVIGNNDYRHLKRLRTAVNDAREVARVLEGQYGFKVTLLANATRYEVLSVLNQLREALTEKDNLVIYYAGHGEIDQKNQRGHWLPVDAEPNSTANWISNIQVTDVLNAMTVQQLLVVADSCYAGTLTRSSLGRLEGGMSETERLRVIQNLAQKRSRMVLTSGGVEPVLDSAGGPHSAFAQIFLDLLQQNVGVLPGQDLFRLLQLRVAAIAQRLETSQVPEYAPIKYAGHESGDFFFVRAGN